MLVSYPEIASNRPVTDHAFPFQRSDRAPAIATQNLADLHEIGPSEAATRRAVRIVNHRDPFHRCVGAPAITQNCRDTHDTAPAKLLTLGSTCTDHLEPFHTPRIGRNAPVKSDEYTSIPTATQNRGNPHETSVH